MRIHKRLTSLIYSVGLFWTASLLAGEGKFVNPVTDICWSCLFPLHVAGANVTPKYKEHTKYGTSLCHCNQGIIGIPLAFWEPNRLIDVTRTPYNMVGLGGISLAKSDIRKKGSVSSNKGRSKKSFYHVHYYQYPVLSILDLANYFVCTDTLPLDIGYMSEFDPLWDDEKWSAVFHPEAFLFANPLATVACIPDCMTSSFGKPIDSLFWCAGCQGSVYPYLGHVAHHVGGIQASSLLVHRLIAKLHALGVLWGFKKDNFCNQSAMPRIKKSLYKTQLAYPVAQTKGSCNSLGGTDLIWGSGKSYPFKGEDFCYVIWMKKHCCLDPAKIALKVSTGGAS